MNFCHFMRTTECMHLRTFGAGKWFARITWIPSPTTGTSPSSSSSSANTLRVIQIWYNCYAFSRSDLARSTPQNRHCHHRSLAFGQLKTSGGYSESICCVEVEGHIIAPGCICNAPATPTNLARCTQSMSMAALLPDQPVRSGCRR